MGQLAQAPGAAGQGNNNPAAEYALGHANPTPSWVAVS